MKCKPSTSESPLGRRRQKRTGSGDQKGYVGHRGSRSSLKRKHTHQFGHFYSLSQISLFNSCRFDFAAPDPEIHPYIFPHFQNPSISFTMSFAGSKISKPTKPPNSTPPANLTPSSRSSSSSSSLSSHLAMVELKQRILTSLSKLSDRDTYQIAVEDLEKIIHTLAADGLLMLLNCLYDASADPKPAVKKESLRLLALSSSSHPSHQDHLPHR